MKHLTTSALNAAALGIVGGMNDIFQDFIDWLKRIISGDSRPEVQRGREALHTLITRAAKARKGGHELTGAPSIIHNAMFVRGIGKIDFRWGHFDKKDGKGFGISKIIGAQKLKREYYKDPVFTQRFVMLIPDILASGKPSKVGKTRLKITHNKDFVFLEKLFDGKPSDNWVMNAYQEVPPHQRERTEKIAKLLRAEKRKKAGR